jgi:hypothetical protein
MPKHCAKKAQIFTGGVKFVTQHRKVRSSRVLQWRKKLLLDSAVDVEVADTDHIWKPVPGNKPLKRKHIL